MVTLRRFLLNQYKIQKRDIDDITKMDGFGILGYLCRNKLDLDSALEKADNIKLKKTKSVVNTLKEAYDDTDVITAIVNNRSVGSLFWYCSIRGGDVITLINSYAKVYEEENDKYYLSDFYFKRNNMYISKNAYYYIRYSPKKDILYLIRDENKSPKKNINNKRKSSVNK